MTTSELVLYIILGLFTAKDIWITIRNFKNKDTEVKLAEINSDSKDIENLKAKNKRMMLELKIVEHKYNQIKVAFTIIYPSLQKLMENDPTNKAALEKLSEYIFEESAGK